MWIVYALLAAFFAGITAFFAKIGTKSVNSTLATAIRTVVIFLFSSIVVIFYNSFNEFTKIDIKTSIYLILSGITIAFLWLSYFKALELGNVNKIASVDKLSIVLTLLLSALLLNEKIDIIKIFSMLLIISGSLLMTSSKRKKVKENKWLIYALLTALFTSLATILGKLGLSNIDSNFATMLRTIIVLFIIWTIVFVKKINKDISKISKKNWLFLFLSGLTTGLSWLFYFKALKDGEASKVFPIEKLSIVISFVFSTIFLKEKYNNKMIVGLILIIIGTLILII